MYIYKSNCTRFVILFLIVTSVCCKKKKCSSKKKQGTGEIKVRFIYSFILFYLCIYLFCLQKYACVIFYANKKHTIIVIDLKLEVTKHIFTETLSSASTKVTGLYSM